MAGKKESFLLVSLNESKAKELAQVVTNDTCRNMLDFLTEREATESEIAKEMALPISTVHYNLQQLIKGGLVVAEEFHYSEKGKTVNHYKLANKFIIIAPKSTWGLKEKLRKILPIAGITVAAAAAVQFAQMFFSRAGNAVFAKSSEMLAAPVMDEAVAAGGEMMLRAAPEAAPEIASFAVEQGVGTPVWQYIGLWFLIGGFFAIIVYLLVDWIKNK